MLSFSSIFSMNQNDWRWIGFHEVWPPQRCDITNLATAVRCCKVWLETSGTMPKVSRGAIWTMHLGYEWCLCVLLGVKEGGTKRHALGTLDQCNHCYNISLYTYSITMTLASHMQTQTSPNLWTFLSTITDGNCFVGLSGRRIIGLVYLASVRPTYEI